MLHFHPKNAFIHYVRLVLHLKANFEFLPVSSSLLNNVKCYSQSRWVQHPLKRCTS